MQRITALLYADKLCIIFVISTIRRVSRRCETILAKLQIKTYLMTILFCLRVCFLLKTSTVLTDFTLDEIFCHRRRVDRQSDVSHSPSCSRMSSGFPSPCTISVHHLPSDFVAFPSVVGWIRSALLWGTVGAILLTCDHHTILFLFAVYSDGCMLTRRLIYSFLILSILVFPAAFLRHLISVVATLSAIIV